MAAGSWWHMPSIPALGSQRQAGLCEFQSSLFYKRKFQDSLQSQRETLSPKTKQNIFPKVLAERVGMVLAWLGHPICVEIKSGADPGKISSTQCSRKQRRELHHTMWLLKLGVLKPLQSSWNTPQLPVKKPHTNDDSLVKDVREVNERVMDVHPTVPNPYTLLSTLRLDEQWYMVVDVN